MWYNLRFSRIFFDKHGSHRAKKRFVKIIFFEISGSFLFIFRVSELMIIGLHCFSDRFFKIYGWCTGTFLSFSSINWLIFLVGLSVDNLRGVDGILVFGLLYEISTELLHERSFLLRVSLIVRVAEFLIDDFSDIVEHILTRLTLIDALYTLNRVNPCQLSFEYRFYINLRHFQLMVR